MATKTLSIAIWLFASSVVFSFPVMAENVVELPVLAAIRANDKGVFELLLLR